ncbi:MAG: radical SAM family heme chaperone HemW [Gammaproteobacteria bacterium]|nr:radical SAM family heme chaperone HemW [Gammaproteobacteria bacterium]
MERQLTESRTALKLPPLSLYVHIPWCLRKCPYCDFNSHTAPRTIEGEHKTEIDLPEAAYVQQLQRDLSSQLLWVQGRKLGSIFFGGGTPSLFSSQAIDTILQAAETHIGFTSNIEITLEANPGTFEQAKFSDYRAAGVNRLSIGVQSFDQRQLEKLGRIHSDLEAVKAATQARKAGFDNINIDLMHGLPQQTEAEALSDLKQAVALGAEHISWYQLTIEPNTAFYRAPPPTPDAASIAAIQAAGREYLTTQGYRRYEVSAYSRPGLISQHNWNYWTFADYLGIGAGAHGKITLPQQGQIIRSRRTRAPRHYLELPLNRIGQLLPPQSKVINDSDLPLEFLMNALRLTKGVPTETFPTYTGLPLAPLSRHWPALQQLGLVQPLTPNIRASNFGYNYLDEILQRFLAPC